ncbi:Histidine-specific methyltransferase EgtD [Bremerella volcania]|uniref:Histidine-specific methyltransferase EgtD n=1 Tax=Bremerella volcania TaxID=2527984 RepID=A0A518CD12_9BACT|nr:L-histidine N(alpha)-methyltransferase [Bremerella volcania]QDU77110.1 Histidine-specific methyltransferase EgtD [Bremerella volcania]
MIRSHTSSPSISEQAMAQLADERFLSDSLAGLKQSPKQLPCKYFYDQRGSQLFDQICETEDYYLTRTETAIMQRYAGEMGKCLGEGVMLVEFGSGSSIKTRYLLDHLIDPVAYVPVDISREHLRASAGQISGDYPNIKVHPVCADFTKPFSLPNPKRRPSHDAVYFPGSTIGNFQPSQAKQLLASIAHMCGEQGGLLIGIDLRKDREILERAYNDDQGITAEFNLNLLHRMRKELGATLDVNAFEHHAFYNAEKGRIEIYLRSQIDQTIRLDGQTVHVEAGELIHTEYSHKYTIDGFAQMAADVGWTLRRWWTDENDYFAVLHLVVL